MHLHAHRLDHFRRGHVEHGAAIDHARADDAHLSFAAFRCCFRHDSHYKGTGRRVCTLSAVARKPSIAIVGPGALGSAVARALHASGYTVAEIVSRDNAASLRHARELARVVGARATTFTQARLDADVVWLCVPDDAIADCARVLARRRDVEWRGRIVLHSSGALSSSLLQPLARRGAAIGSLHPMMTFVRERQRA